MPERETVTSTERLQYAAALDALNHANVKFLVGGGFGLSRYLGCWRATKDLDLFVRPSAVMPALSALSAAGFECDLTDPSWLAKARKEGVLTDIIFCSYNGLLSVVDSWFENSRPSTFWDVPVRLVGPEEMIVSKCFVAARDRFDGSDISRMIRALDGRIDWQRVERELGEHWPVLLWQLVHYCYVFPADQHAVPRRLLRRLMKRLDSSLAGPSAPGAPCRGPLLDPLSYRGVDVVSAPCTDEEHIT